MASLSREVNRFGLAEFGADIVFGLLHPDHDRLPNRPVVIAFSALCIFSTTICLATELADYEVATLDDRREHLPARVPTPRPLF
jgi:hypothetical protein